MSGGRIAILIVLLLAAALAAAALLGGQRGAVDWRAARVVAFESDDWGLCGLVPAAGVVGPGERDALGRLKPAVYWESTLEDSASVAALAGVLAAHRGRDGLPAVLQANMILSGLTPPADPGRVADPRAWVQTDLPALPDLYGRPGLWHAVFAAIDAGVWLPEYHGAYHYDPDRRRAALAASPLAFGAARRGVLVFPGSDRAWELGSWRRVADLARELDHSLAAFTALFGRRPASVVAPDYVWDDRCEALWESRGLTVVQAKREQLEQFRWAGGQGQRVLKVIGRTWDRAAHPRRVYLDRNCSFEPAQAPGAAEVARCLAQIETAWRRGQPAIVGTHRVNYVDVTAGAAAARRDLLVALLDSLAGRPGGPPLYLTDTEIAQLVRQGVSVTRRGTATVLRNLTRSSRLVASPATPSGAVAVPGGATLILGSAPLRPQP